MNKYEKLRLVGRGAYGTVFLCDRLEDNKRVILKEIPVDQMSADERQASVNEAKVLSMLEHPNIVGYYESFLEEKTMTIVMEYVQGGTLFDFLRQRDGTLLDEKEVLNYFGQMVYTLQYVHSKLILHRDLKSQNILLSSNKTVLKIGDFGISKVLTSKSKAYTVVGTPCYISPELCEGKPYNQKSDIWAVGCILYELMTLKRPFDAETLPALVMKIMKGNYDPVPDIYSLELRKLLMSMLHLDPDQRPTAAQIMCQPFMINTVFRLYVDIGSISIPNRSTKGPKRSSLGSSSSLSYERNSNNSSFKISNSVRYAEKKKDVWFFENTSNPTLLPSSPKGIIKSLSLGSSHKIGLTGSGLLVSWQTSAPYISVQDESSNQEMIQFPTYVASLVDERFAINITSVVSGNEFTLCQSDNGVVFSFGKACSGCLGHASNKDITEPKIIEALFSRNIISIASGPKHALAISDEHEVFAWGYDTHGCLGLQNTNFKVIPEKVEIIYENQNPEKIFCGPDCSFIITVEKSLLTCGSNRHNKLALDSGEGHHTDQSNTFTLVSSEVLQKNKIKSVSAGQNHTVILCENNEVYSVGSNQFFQLGWGEIGLNYSMLRKIEKLNSLKILQIACCDYFTAAITDDKSLYCWGKCPRSFGAKEEICIFESPPHLSNKSVLSISCDSENCLILAEEDCKSPV